MTPERYARLKEVFAAACALETQRRSAYLDEACAGDEELRCEVEDLLVHDAQSLSMLSDSRVGEAVKLPLGEVWETRSSAGGHEPAPDTERFPAQIGQYRIIGRIGAGGMGTVFEAEQQIPRRTIALKVIRHGVSSPMMLRRFELEAHVLGRLQHPGIAQIYEAGTARIETAHGEVVEQPFFAMEYIRGQTLTDAIANRDLDLRQRLLLFGKVCDAVHHAHQKGVIHRDLKPSNILVDESGQPKILDFGVARVTDSAAQLATMQTGVGQIIGTVQYMSPEQVSGDPRDLDLRSDVYALGVILFQLLTGRPPQDLSQMSIPRAARAITDLDAPLLGTLNRDYRGDLETIVAKALERDRTQRYQSASELAADVRHYLRDEPIEARPASTVYQLRKFARRHRALVAGATAAVLALAVGAVVSTWQAVRATRAERLAQSRFVDAEEARVAEQEQRRLAETKADEARRAAIQAEAVSDFLCDMLASSDPSYAVGKEITVREVLDETARDIDAGSLRGQPELEASVHHTLGFTYRALGEYDAAETHLRTALRIREDLYGDEHADVATSMNNLATLLLARGEYAEAEMLCRRSLEIRRKLFGDDSAHVGVSLNNLGLILQATGDYAGAERSYRDALRIERALGTDAYQEVATTLSNIAAVLQAQGDLDQAEPLLREAVALNRELHASVHPELARTICNLAGLLHNQGALPEAEALYREALELRWRLYGARHPEIAVSLYGLGAVLYSQNDFEGAEPFLRQALAMDRELLGNEHPDVLRDLNALGATYRARGDLDGAEAIFRETLDLRRKILGDEHPDVATSMNNLGWLLVAKDEYDEARALYGQALALRRRVLGDDHPLTQLSLFNLADLLLEINKLDKAEPLFRELLAIRRAQLGDMHPMTALAFLKLGIVLRDSGQLEEAETVLRQSVAAHAAAFAPDDWHTAYCESGLADCLTKRGTYDQAEQLLLTAQERLAAQFGEEHEQVQLAWRRLAKLYEAQGQPDKAAPWRARLTPDDAGAPQPASDD
ncbi:MAG: tetratricopeptide repeat protein [Phycisphaerae bacterium]|nr:tetratricopeptide repeat protein [Phycisphaerae bacterium]